MLYADCFTDKINVLPFQTNNLTSTHPIITCKNYNLFERISAKNPEHLIQLFRIVNTADKNFFNRLFNTISGIAVYGSVYIQFLQCLSYICVSVDYSICRYFSGFIGNFSNSQK